VLAKRCLHYSISLLERQQRVPQTTVKKTPAIWRLHSVHCK